MFTDFFSQVSGEPMSEAQQAVMVDAIDELHKQERTS